MAKQHSDTNQKKVVVQIAIWAAAILLLVGIVFFALRCTDTGSSTVGGSKTSSGRNHLTYTIWNGRMWLTDDGEIPATIERTKDFYEFAIESNNSFYVPYEDGIVVENADYEYVRHRYNSATLRIFNCRGNVRIKVSIARPTYEQTYLVYQDNNAAIEPHVYNKVTVCVDPDGTGTIYDAMIRFPGAFDYIDRGDATYVNATVTHEWSSSEPYTDLFVKFRGPADLMATGTNPVIYLGSHVPE